MDKNKVVFSIVIAVGLLAICIYQKLKLDEADNFLEKENLKKIQLEELKRSLSHPKFLKPKDKIFQKNESLKKEVFTIFKKLDINIYFKEISRNCFEIKFKANEEEKIYIAINKLRRNLGGIITIDNLHIVNEAGLLKVTIKFKIFIPPEEIKKYIYVKKSSNEDFISIFNLEKKKSYQLNGISHYKAAYINGIPFYKGDMLGKHKIVEISEDFIVIQKEKTFTKISIDEMW